MVLPADSSMTESKIRDIVRDGFGGGTSTQLFKNKKIKNLFLDEAFLVAYNCPKLFFMHIIVRNISSNNSMASSPWPAGGRFRNQSAPPEKPTDRPTPSACPAARPQKKTQLQRPCGSAWRKFTGWVWGGGF